MEASELLAIWKNFGLSEYSESRALLAVALRENGDYSIRTTPELIDASIECEMDGISFMPPSPTCPSCNDEDECDKDWTYGHRFDWWVCTQCKRVMPCRHGYLADVDEHKLTGTCHACGMRMPYSFVADYLMKRYAEKAEEFRGFADAARQQEESRCEFCCNPYASGNDSGVAGLQW